MNARHAVCLILLAACGARPPAREAAPSALPVERYLPLENDTVMAYGTRVENTGERGVVMLEVVRPRPGAVELRDGGTVTRLELAPDGVRYLTGGYWLKPPLVQGTCWPGKSGQTCVTGVNRTVAVPAGRFTGCLETVETTAAGSRVTTRFCPGVGMTTLDVENDAGGSYERVRAELRSYGPRVDINRLPDTLREGPR